MHWAVAAGWPLCQLYRANVEHSHSTHWVELKAFLIPLATTPLNKPCYIFTDSGDAAGGLHLGSAAWKITNWKFENNSLRP